MNNINELVSKNNMSNLRILKIKSIPEIDGIIVLKTNSLDSEFFIEILDFDNNKIKQFLLDKKISDIRDFHSIDLEYLYLNGSYNGDFDCHLKIDSNNGEIIFHKKFDTETHSLNYKYILKNYIFREDLVLLNLENFEEYNLYDFISDNFDDEYNFTYLYFSEGRYEIFTFPYNNIIGFEIFDKDGDEPRCTYIILKIENNKNIQIKFVGKIEDAGYDYILSPDSNEIAYKSTLYNKPNNILIRDLAIDNFQNAEVHIKDESLKIVYFNREKIIFKNNNMLEIFERKSNKLLNSIKIENDSLFLIKNDTLFYVNNNKLNAHQI
ncbi:hypothetical protein [Flavobacterium gyeonganense]|uniref:Uncharacterized protein n=1 Tax=Flavobacterium gyeonganense TaxID=1310418 RepID=A0ABV5HF02_9FLAO|nr:hypothetical protein [Flavobacterium gyeonganense]